MSRQHMYDRIKPKPDGIIIPFGVSVRGDVELELINVRTGLVEGRRAFQNLLLASYLNAVMGATSPTGVLYGGLGSFCRIGTSGTPPQRADSGILGTQLASVAPSTNTLSAAGVYPIVRTMHYVFPAGTGTGTVREVVLNGSLGATARQIVSPEMEKTALHELRVTWTLTLTRQADAWSGTITFGQRDGLTDIIWVATINNRQLYNVASYMFAHWNTLVSVRTGTSNAASDLGSDSPDTIKGTQLFSGTPSLSTGYSYTPGTYYRDYTYGFEIGQSNGLIGEMVIGPDYSARIARITFDPPLDKVNTYRLYITIRTSLVNPS